METRICHLFAGLIAFIDTNRNLDLLTSPSGHDFSSLWLQMFTDNELLEVNYRLYLLANNLEKPEFVCTQATGRLTDEKLQLRLPFSWVIKHTMDQLVGSQILTDASESIRHQSDESSMVDNNNNQILNSYHSLTNVFQKSKLYEKLGEEVINEKEFINSFINDYLLLTSVTCDQPLIINNNHVLVALKRIKDFSRLTFKKTDLVAVTLSWTMLKNELSLLAKFVRFYPNVS